MSQTFTMKNSLKELLEQAGPGMSLFLPEDSHGGMGGHLPHAVGNALPCSRFRAGRQYDCPFGAILGYDPALG